MPDNKDEKMSKDDLMLEKLTCIQTKLDAYHTETKGSQTKIIFALMGIITATLGIKFIGTPIIVDIMVYFCLGGGVFLAGITYGFWRSLNIQQRCLKITGSAFMLTNAIIKIIFNPGGVNIETNWPFWISPLLDGFLVALALFMIWGAWNTKYKRKD